MTNKEADDLIATGNLARLIQGTLRDLGLRDDDERQEVAFVLLAEALPRFRREKGAWGAHARRWASWALARYRHTSDFKFDHLDDAWEDRRVVASNRCACGQPVVAKGRCRGCYTRYYRESRKK